MILQILLAIALINTLSISAPTILQTRSDFVDSLPKNQISIFFYGEQDTQQYAAFQTSLSQNKQVFSNLSFYFVPSSSVKLSKQEKSLFMYRNIEGNEWLTYDGPSNTNGMSEWIKHNCFDSLPQATGSQIDDMFVGQKSGFILLDMGTFDLLATKILINDYCNTHHLMCRKCGLDNEALRVVVQLMEADDEFGISKLAFWNAQQGQFDIFKKAPLIQLTKQNLIELHGIKSQKQQVSKQETRKSQQQEL